MKRFSRRATALALSLLLALFNLTFFPMHYKNGKFGFENLESLADFMTKSDRKIAVSTGEYFTLPEEDNLLIVPSSV